MYKDNRVSFTMAKEELKKLNDLIDKLKKHDTNKMEVKGDGNDNKFRAV
jgi:hypothetical protein